MAKESGGRARTPQARQRAAELRRQQEAAERRRTLISRVAMIAVLVLIGGGVIGYAAYANAHKDDKPAFDDLPGVKVFKDLSRDHTPDPVTYPETPPVGGAHNSNPLTCGIYDVPVPNENAVHDLEHGAVWITYQPDLKQADVDKLRQLVTEKSSGFLDLSPYPGLPAPVVASAWGRQQTFSSLSAEEEDKLGKFIDFYQHGPQTPEPNAACIGTLTDPKPISTPGG